MYTTSNLLILFSCLSLAIVSSAYQTAPASFNVLFTTTKGSFNLYVNRSWAPNGADHFYQLVQSEYYNENAFFRVIQSPTPFVAQWGISGSPEISEKWNITIPDDPIFQSNLPGTVTYAAEMNGTMACCRTTQLFINYVNNSRLDAMGFVPFGIITKGFNVTMDFYSGYGEEPDQTEIYSEGNPYLEKNFPLLDYIVTANVV
ncbi:hypothetical protein SAMD00019534_017630 [Acytostelium subglobosum LB1]|uniref:hypothetical protein n=1 Tax=Acytostelium subglobosum LB1 TaxID=1410327 RepID=UPI000645083A|nr:hypothetical protein SAMD00019534_017630 [Acytostelium subglobosum LB1]GAM18588.1 hypothetical protein SAMD00019534_017630 [Acytostelium subglobosum LB1]|eukprot:XP_012757808.1 hypothetical protein SAMD00019534_017630 [Acytostelium subglobosum LB1]